MSNGTALNPGQQAEFLKTGVGALVLLSHELDPTTSDMLARNSEVMKTAFKRALTISFPFQPRADGVRIVKTTPVIIGGGRTTDQIVEKARKLEGKNRTSYIDSNITQGKMPSGNGRRRMVFLEWFEFTDRDPATEEVRLICEEPGHGYSTYEDGLIFQENYPDAQKERPHVVIPENPYNPGGDFLRALNLYGGNNSRELLLGNCGPRSIWVRSCLFARRKY